MTQHNRPEAESIVQALTAGQSPSEGDSLVFSNDGGWSHGPGGPYKTVSRDTPYGDPDPRWDAQVVIQDALDSISGLGGGVVFLQNGIYELDSGIEVPQNCGLIGESMEGVQLKIQANSVTAITANPGCLIRDITVDGNARSYHSCIGLALGTAVSRCKIYNLRFNEIQGRAIDILDAYDNHFFSIHAEDCGQNSLALGSYASINIRHSGDTSNMNFFYGVQIQEGYYNQINLSSGSMHNVFIGGHLEWSSGNVNANTFPAISCAGYRNRFFGIHIAKATNGIYVTGPRNEIHGCYFVSNSDYGFEFYGALADKNKAIGGFSDGWRVQGGDDNEIHGVDTNTRNCVIDGAPNTRVVGGTIEGVAGSAGLTLQNSADKSVVDGLYIVAASGEKTIYNTSASCVFTNCVLEVSGTVANNIDSSGGTGNIITENQLSGTTTADVIASGASALMRDNRGFITQNEGSETQSGNGISFIIPHGCDITPHWANVTAGSDDAKGDFWVSGLDGTNIGITYSGAPASGTDNLTWYWSCGLRHRI